MDKCFDIVLREIYFNICFKILLNQVTFGSNSYRSLGPKIWNGLSNDFKTAENLTIFKRLIKSWEGPECQSNASRYEK